MNKVQRTVSEHDKDIKDTKAGLVVVNQKVVVVEQDLEETKEKVEEIDMKVYVSNLWKIIKSKISWTFLCYGYCVASKASPAKHSGT